MDGSDTCHYLADRSAPYFNIPAMTPIILLLRLLR